MVKEGLGDGRPWGLKQDALWRELKYLGVLLWVSSSCLHARKSLAVILGPDTFAGVGNPDLGLTWSLGCVLIP